MLFRKFGVALGALALVAACGGGADEAPPADTPAPAATAAAPTPAPITGTTHDVKMIGDEKGTRYEPAMLTVAPGDGIKFEVVSLAPHNVQFDVAKLSPEQKAALSANMPNQDMGELTSPFLMTIGDAFTMSFGNVPPGTYDIMCTPHVATGMTMKVEVK